MMRTTAKVTKRRKAPSNHLGKSAVMDDRVLEGRVGGRRPSDSQQAPIVPRLVKSQGSCDTSATDYPRWIIAARVRISGMCAGKIGAADRSCALGGGAHSKERAAYKWAARANG